MEKIPFDPEAMPGDADNIPEGARDLQQNIEETKEVLGEYVSHPENFESLTTEEAKEVGTAWRRVVGGFMALIGGGVLTALGAGGYEAAIKAAEANEKFFGGGDQVLTSEIGLGLLAALAAIETAIGAKWLIKGK